MRRLLTIVWLLTATLAVWAQPPHVVWQRSYGGSDEDYATSIIQTGDGGFLIAGSSKSFNPFQSPDAYFVRTDSLGDTVWTQTFGGTLYEDAWSVKRVPDGGFAALGSIVVPGGRSDFLLIRLDSTGTVVWTRSLALPQQYGTGYGLDVCTDGGFILSGETGSGDFSAQGLLMKTDSLGIPQWSLSAGSLQYSPFFDVRQTSDGGYIAVGPGMSSPSCAAAYAVKVSADGQLQWERYYNHGDTTMNDEAYAVCEVSGGGYLIGGNTYSFARRTDFFVVRVDTAGDTLWTTTFTMDTVINRPDWEELHAVFELPQGGYAVAGLIGTEDGAGNVTPGTVVARLDTSGHVLWRAMYAYDSLETWAATLTADGGIATAGLSRFVDGTGWNVGVLRLGPLDLSSGSSPPAALLPHSLALSAFPKPFNSALEIQYQLPQAQRLELSVYNLLGQKVATLFEGTQAAGAHSERWSPRGAGGLYFVQLAGAGTTKTAKVLYLK